ncbi:MAG: nickel ABC transporter substrate-binding protein [Treponemataceae bacterium]
MFIYMMAIWLHKGFVFEGLVKNTADGIKLWLAKKWDVSEDGREYTFYLRDDVKFTDGEPFNAEAVKLNIDAVQENKKRHSWLELSNKIQNCEVVDEYTVKLKLSDPYYPALVELGLTRPYRMMSPATFIDGKTSNGVKENIGTGPYKIEEYVEDQYATFIANEEHWDKAPAIKHIKMLIMPSGETPLMAMMNGEVDLIFSRDVSGLLNIDSLLNLKENEKFKVEFSPPCSTRFLLTNNLSERLISDKNIKNAVWHAINKEDFCKYVMSELELPSQTVFARSVPYCDLDLDLKEFNQDRAKELIEASGWKFNEKTGYYSKDNKTLTLELVYSSTSEQNKAICEFIQSNLKDAGMEVVLVPSEENSVRQLRSAGKYDIYLDRT